MQGTAVVKLLKLYFLSSVFMSTECCTEAVPSPFLPPFTSPSLHPAFIGHLLCAACYGGCRWSTDEEDTALLSGTSGLVREIDNEQISVG